MSCTGVSSFPIPPVPQILTSMSSVVGGDSRTLNHGGELKVQQELVGPPGYACLTEIVSTYKRGNTVSSNAPSDTGACPNRNNFVKTTTEAPDVLARGTVSYTYSINIEGIN